MAVYLSCMHLTRHTGAHTDSRKGAKTHFLAKMHKGVGRFVGEGIDISFHPGDIFYIPIGFHYDSYWDNDLSGEDVVWDSISFSWFPENIEYPPQRLELSDTLRGEFDRLTSSFDRIDCKTVGGFYSLLAKLVCEMKPIEEKRTSELFETASRYLKNDPSLSVGDTARLCGVSESGLFAEFHSFGTTPIKVRLKAQLDRATELLATTDLTVEEISERCGFGSAAYFYRAFRKHTGKTTRQVRGRGRM